MGAHPLNLAVRFALELAVLATIGAWGWRQAEGWPRFALAIALPLVAATAWGVLAVPGDPSRSGAAPIPVPGIVRLVLELSLFAVAVVALRHIGRPGLAAGLAGATLLHYLLSWDRIAWLLGR